ncbi:quaternary ammonium compound-resistance protein SugE [Saccharopolyspora antimicrobica]|uniref:Quaternary ammonium compound-resistance protein SugE n=1 Tax=Saccharopolyspora antimicrobica TaxID=455193 RepID=A0A1I5ICW2_9PSEU|nr:multidrug efflux SMR transporter [Saccharopolyspora antimicrobica]RKT85532.1 quaternary ammonium compound-resistance protein SugE [Saccharopolyspora antimicrobica]SFO58352.1 quaternary ammonium compound-resistance protein SugE [Saccharopolyspora antimicrobica]
MAWILLIVAGLLEIVWSLALKHAEGMTRLWPAVVGIAVAMVSLGLLSVALKHLPVGSAYAIWVGIGTIGVAAVGMLAFGEPVTWPRLAFLALILVGIAGLKFAEA